MKVFIVYTDIYVLYYTYNIYIHTYILCINTIHNIYILYIHIHIYISMYLFYMQPCSLMHCTWLFIVVVCRFVVVVEDLISTIIKILLKRGFTVFRISKIALLYDLCTNLTKVSGHFLTRLENSKYSFTLNISDFHQKNLNLNHN